MVDHQEIENTSMYLPNPSATIRMQDKVKFLAE